MLRCELRTAEFTAARLYATSYLGVASYVLRVEKVSLRAWGHQFSIFPVACARMSGKNFDNRTVYCGDNLYFLRGMNSECVDLIATDPPFKKDKDFYAKAHPDARFQDRWRWEDIHDAWTDNITDSHPELMNAIEYAKKAHGESMAAYLCYMAVRLVEMHRILKPTGTIVLHCDMTASHYLKTIMDVIFGQKNFRNEIIWGYNGGGVPKKDFPRKHDNLLRYVKSKEWTFNVEYQPYKENTQQVGKHSTLSGGGDIPLDRGTPITSVWTNIKTITGWSPERVDEEYPTQKPVELYRRIVRACSNEGDVVLDPFCGCATTLEAAETLKREWVGIDLYPQVTKSIKDRLAKRSPLFKSDIKEPSTKPPVRTDAGKEAIAFLEALTNEKGPRMSRQMMLDWLLEDLVKVCKKLICPGCAHVVARREWFHLDHVEPVSGGGSNLVGNRIPLCSACNNCKSNTLQMAAVHKENAKNGHLAEGYTTDILQQITRKLRILAQKRQDDFMKTWHLKERKTLI